MGTKRALELQLARTGPCQYVSSHLRDLQSTATDVALSRYLGEMFSIGIITMVLHVPACITSLENHSLYTSNLVIAMSLSICVILAERSLIIKSELGFKILTVMINTIASEQEG